MRGCCGAGGALLRHTRLRFESLACCLLPLLAVILLNSTRSTAGSVIFLYGAFCLLAIGGLHALAPAARHCPGGKGLAYGLAIGGTGATLRAAAHPRQHMYFNLLEERATPERLRIRYDLDCAGAYWQVLEFLLAPYPEEPLYILSHKKEGAQNRDMLPAAKRQRIELSERRYRTHPSSIRVRRTATPWWLWPR